MISQLVMKKLLQSTLVAAMSLFAVNSFGQMANGSMAPTLNLTDLNGNTYDVDALLAAGKTVFIDVSATWCGPCREEIPSLEKVKEQFQGKNIVFVSISIDKSIDREKWSKLINDKNMSGIQLLADNEWDSKFIREYNIGGIPKFILIDANGNIVNAQAPKPSDPKLIELLNSLPL